MCLALVCVPLRSLPTYSYRLRHLCPNCAVSGRDLKERYLNTRGIRRQSRDEALLDFLFERPARGAAPALSARAAQTDALQLRFLAAQGPALPVPERARLRGRTRLHRCHLRRALSLEAVVRRRELDAAVVVPAGQKRARSATWELALGTCPLCTPWPLGLAKLGCGGEESKDQTWERVASRCQGRPHCSRISARSIRAAGAL